MIMEKTEKEREEPKRQKTRRQGATVHILQTTPFDGKGTRRTKKNKNKQRQETTVHILQSPPFSIKLIFLHCQDDVGWENYP
jgi:hypothetical protein